MTVVDAVEVGAVAGVGERVESDDVSSGWRSSQYRTKFEPMKPAPPVTSSFMADASAHSTSIWQWSPTIRRSARGRRCDRAITASRPISESSRRGMSDDCDSSITTECSISQSTISQPAPMAVNGPMKLSTTACPAPMMAGPRIVELTISAPGLDDDPAVDRRRVVDRAVDARLELLEQQPVGLEQRRQLAGVDPPARQQLGAHPVAVVDQPLDGVGDLQLAAGRRLDGPHRLVDRRVEQVDADERQVGRRVAPASRPADDVAVGVELGHAEAVRVGDLLQQDLGGGRIAVDRAPRSRDERAEVLLEQVVAEVHDEVVVAEEVAGDQHAVGEAERRVLGDVGDGCPEPRPVAERRRGPRRRCRRRSRRSR